MESWRVMALGDEQDFLGTEPSAALADLVERVVRESGMESLYRKSKSEEDLDRLENLEELISAAAQFEPTVDESDAAARDAEPRIWNLMERLDAYLESVALVSDADVIDPAGGAVTLMTLHAAKGLEFEVVAVAGLEDGLLPHMRAAQDEMQMEEERRLCFVGMTRAKRHLLLTRAAQRTHRGLRERTIPSPFLQELPGELIIESDQADDLAAFDPYEDEFDVQVTAGRGRGAVLRAAFPRGCLVRHPTFGLGRVESVTPRPAGSSARVRFQSVGMKTLILEYAKLERVE
jgi:DNA helicase-2/ATP-dependent DNA helicase PcrA